MLYFETKNEFTTVIELLEEFIYPYPKATFFDKELFNIQCGWGSNRSISDLLRICQTYISNTNLSDILLTLYDFYNDCRKNIPSLLFCPNINKVVVGLSNSNFDPDFIQNTAHYPLKCNNEEILDKLGQDGYTLNNLKQILNESLSTEDQIP